MPQTFGEFLKIHLDRKKWSAEQLAKELSKNGEKIDGGIVRAWIRGVRIPRLGHKCIEQMTQLFSLDHPNELEKIQIESLKQRKSGKKENFNQKKSRENYIEPLTELDNLPAEIIINDYRPKQEHGSIQEYKKIGETMIAMINDVNKFQNNTSFEKAFTGEILMTFQSLQSIFYSDKKIKLQWHKSLLKAVNNGWKIIHLIRLEPGESKRTYEFVSNSFNLFEGPGHYEPRCFNQKTILRPSYGLFLLPNEGLTLFSAEVDSLVDSAIYTRDKQQLKILNNHYLRLKDKTTPIFQEYSSYEQKGFVEKILKSEDEPGDRIIFSRRLSEITRPLKWYDTDHPWAQALTAYLTKTGPKGINYSEHIAHRKARAEKIEKYLGYAKYSCKYIYPKSCFENFVKDGQHKPYYFKADIKQRIEQIERILELLKFDNYEIALVDGERPSIYDRIKPSFCEVQGSHTFFMEFWYEGNDPSEKNSKWFLTEERLVVRSFQEYLSKIWKVIPDREKNKYDVIGFFEDQIEKLKLMIDKSS
jgi:hypothetical protein